MPTTNQSTALELGQRVDHIKIAKRIQNTIDGLNSLMREMEIPYKDFQKFLTQYNTDKPIFESATNEKDKDAAYKELEKTSANIITKYSILNVKIDSFIGQYAKIGDLLRLVEHAINTTPIYSEVSQIKQKFNDIARDVLDKYKAIKNDFETNAYIKLANSIKKLETQLAKTVKAASEYYIYLKADVWHVEKLVQEELIELQNEDIVLRNITQEDYTHCIALAQHPDTVIKTPKNLVAFITDSKMQYDAINGSSKTTTTTNLNGSEYALTTKHVEQLQLIIKFNQILIKAGITGEVSFNFGKKGEHGTFSFSAKAFYDLSATATACISAKNFHLAAKASAKIGAKADLNVKSKALEVAGKKFEIQVGFNVNIEGSAKVSAELAAQWDINADALNDYQVGEMVTGRFGVEASAWAGVSAGISMYLNLFCDINKVSTKIVNGSVGIKAGIGIGTTAGALQTKSIFTEAENVYVKKKISIELAAFANLKFEAEIQVLKALEESEGNSVIDTCVALVTEELREALIASIKQAIKDMYESIGNTVKDGLKTAKLHVDASVLRSAIIAAQKLFASHQTVINSQITQDNAQYILSRQTMSNKNELLKDAQDWVDTVSTTQTLVIAITNSVQVGINNPKLYQENYSTIVTKIKDYSKKLKNNCKVLEDLSKIDLSSGTVHSADILYKGLLKAMPQIEVLLSKAEEKLHDIENTNNEASEELEKYVTKLRTNLEAYKEKSLNLIEKELNLIAEPLFKLPINLADVSRSEKEVLIKSYHKIAETIEILARIINEKLELSFDLHSIASNINVDTNAIQEDANLILDQAQEINILFNIIKEEIAPFIA